MLQDLHSHTYYSYCGQDSPEDVIKNAIENKLDIVGISDHYHGIVKASPAIQYESDEAKIKIHNDAIIKYYEHINTLAEKYRNYINVWCGVEISTLDQGYTIPPNGVDVSFFDFCLIEKFQQPEANVDDVVKFALRFGCKRAGFAHVDLPSYVASKGLDMDEFFKRMKKNNIFWELNVNYDSIHGYTEHQYVKDFFQNDKLVEAVKKSGIKLSVGFDGHRLPDYDINRVADACRRIEKLSIPLVM